MDINKNLQIKKTFILNNNKYIAVEGQTCKGCYFNIGGKGCLNVKGAEALPLCSPIVRDDRKSIIFIKL